MTSFVTRFAPSPTGYLHLGHAASAWHVWQTAAAAQGQVLLRIEDIDTTRCKPVYTQAIYDMLRWLGFDWPEPVRVQSEHFPTYARLVEELTERGLTYRCFLSRRQLQSQPAPYCGGPLPAWQEAEALAEGKPFAWRLSLKAARQALGPRWSTLSYTEQTPAGLQTRPVNPALEGDIVLARKDSPSAYHLAATHDDALQGITHIIRGADLVNAPHVQTLLQTLMGWPRPIYQHHALILDDKGQKLSKHSGSPALVSLAASAITPQQIWEQLDLEPPN